MKKLALLLAASAALTALTACGEDNSAATPTVVAAPTDALASMMMQMHGLAAVETPRGDPVSAAVVVDGQPVGAVMLRVPTEAMEAERHVRDALARTALLGVLLAGGGVEGGPRDVRPR